MRTLVVGGPASFSVLNAVASGYVKVAMENGQFIVNLPIEHGDFP